MKIFPIDWDVPAEFYTSKTHPKPARASIGYFRADDGALLRTAVFFPAGPARATLVLMTGYSEFIEKYVPIAQIFTSLGYFVCIPEWRSHGASSRDSRDPHRLHLTDFQQNVRDLQFRLRRVLTSDAPQPVVGLAHSMGGQIMMHACHQDPALVSALALSAPMLGVNLSSFTRLMLHVAGWIIGKFRDTDFYLSMDPPTRSAENPLENWVSFNTQLWDENEAFLREHPKLPVNGRSLGWTVAASRAMYIAAEPSFLRSVQVPIFIGYASDERLVDNTAIERALAILPSAQGHCYMPARHELLMEQPEIRDQFIADVDAFFVDAAGLKPRRAKAAAAPREGAGRRTR